MAQHEHDQWGEQAALFVLGALAQKSASSRRTWRAAKCRQAVANRRSDTDGVVPQIDPPVLRERVRDGAAAKPAGRAIPRAASRRGRGRFAAAHCRTGGYAFDLRARVGLRRAATPARADANVA